MPRRGYRRPPTKGTRKKATAKSPKNWPGSGWGGAREGSGRPAGIPWPKVKAAAEAGASFEDIVATMVPPQFLEDKEQVERLKAEIELGHAKCRVELHLAIRKKAVEDGSTNAQALRARNLLDWDSQQLSQTTAPDADGAANRVLELVAKYKAQQKPEPKAPTLAVLALLALCGLPVPARADVVRSLTPTEQTALYQTWRYDWKLWARPEQLQPAEGWRYWFMIGGRGSGKTRPAAEQVIEWAKVPDTRIALIARDAGQGRKVMVDGESGILPCSPPWFRPKYLPSLKRVVWPNGSIGELHSANEPETTRGPQYHKGWAEELFHWSIPPKAEGKEPIAWREGIRYGIRLGDNPQLVVTSTPRSSEFCHNLLLGPKREDGSRPIQPLAKGDPNRYDADGFPRCWTHETKIEVDGEAQIVRSVIARWPTEDNRCNLSAGKPEEWRTEFGASRIGQQELDGAILTKAKGSLFSTEVIDQWAVDGVPALVRTLVAVDPTRSDAPVDEAGIVVGGLGADGDVYVWDDLSKHGAPGVWIAAALAGRNKYGASEVVYEKNRMPQTLKALMGTLDPRCRWVEVNATENKQTRAEPVSALYAQGKVHHVRDAKDPQKLARLEDEMISWDPKLRMPSPNRMDALVWLVWALKLGEARQEIRLL